MQSAARIAESPQFSAWAVTCAGEHAAWSDPECHDDHRLVLVRAGRFLRRADGAESVLDRTTAYLGRPGQEERFAHPVGGDLCTSIDIGTELWHSIAGDPAAPPVADLYVDARVELWHRRLLLAAGSGDVGFAVAEELVGLVGEVVPRVTGDARPRIRSGARGRSLVADARAAILDDAPGSDGLIPLAGALEVSPFLLSRHFTAVTGVSVTRYRNRVRVGRALARLEGGERDLAVLAADLGFADQAHLTRTMRAHLGRTPGAVRALLSPDETLAEPPRPVGSMSE
ncbi:helix-turn-helix domain protein [Rhodococcus sp. MTM3W5.2]|uniref:helix-turn-helix domain-containing protein n=1 Tax=Rhodococcus sp. MTM3W5.2 TaxID=1805827 RepID=UPI0009796B17|nr:AraC family transcriptional regulator [Rhodococcus sp. MTM3W5.2]AQA22766.1 helix-turn-helix domain protein [Rhodococcus sp. MTM3W5.2]